MTELVTVKETLIENYDILDQVDCQASLADEERIRPKKERKEKIQFLPLSVDAHLQRYS